MLEKTSRESARPLALNRGPALTPAHRERRNSFQMDETHTVEGARRPRGRRVAPDRVRRPRPSNGPARGNRSRSDDDDRRFLGRFSLKPRNQLSVRAGQSSAAKKSMRAFGSSAELRRHRRVRIPADIRVSSGGHPRFVVWAETLKSLSSVTVRTAQSATPLTVQPGTDERGRSEDTVQTGHDRQSRNLSLMQQAPKIRSLTVHLTISTIEVSNFVRFTQR
jgi:hypothetical protein